MPRAKRCLKSKKANDKHRMQTLNGSWIVLFKQSLIQAFTEEEKRMMMKNKTALLRVK